MTTPEPGIAQQKSSARKDASLAAVGHSDRRFETLVQPIEDYAIFLLDPRGNVATWNRGAQCIKGYEAHEIIGQHFSRFYTEDAKARRWPEHELEQAVLHGRFNDEGWRVRKDGSMFWANVTITAIHDSQGRLSGFAKVTRDMTESRRNDELEHSIEQMKQFLALLAHELRNPLAPVRNAVAALRLAPHASPETRRASDLIERQIAHLTRLVDDLLDVGRITSGKIELREAPPDLHEVTAHAVEAAEPFTAARRQQVVVQLPANALRMIGDHTRLVQVLQNLLHNASKFSPDGSSIAIDAHAGARTVQIQVRDNGCGLRPGTFESIFGLFSQDRSMPGPSENGLGIGLMLCRSLVELHGGTISATSAGPGTGSTFTIRLPLERTGAYRPAVQPPSPVQAARETHGLHEQHEPPALRVLIVDDNRDSADSLAMLFELKGHAVRVAYSAAHARAQVEDFTPDAALIDIAMPEIDGYAALRALRAHAPLARTLFAAMTGFGQAADVELTRAAGFEMHLVKPVNAALFDEVLARAAKRRVQFVTGATGTNCR